MFTDISSVFWRFGAYTLLARLREGLRKPMRPAGCLREHKSASRCLRGCLRGQMLSSSVAGKSQLFSTSAVLAAPALRSEMQYK